MKTMLIVLLYCVMFVVAAVLADFGIYKLKKWYHEYKTKGCI